MTSRESFFWWQLEVVFPLDLEESLLWKINSLGVNRVAIEVLIEDVSHATLFSWLPSTEWLTDDRDQFVKALSPLGKSFGLEIKSFKWKKINNEDWSKSWKQYWKPDPVGQHLLILPAWLEIPQEQAHRLILRLDPGSAFGTGSHPTTRLCLEALEKNPPENFNVADIGCGSGILSVAALALGARKIFAVDIDSLAVKSSIENLNLNDVEDARRLVLQGSLNELIEELDGSKVDYIYCNILAPVIEELAPLFGQLLSPNGKVFLSGLLVEQSERLKNLFRSLGWSIDESHEKDNWALLQISRPPN